jgi:small-conductance mechanosensitive channel
MSWEAIYSNLANIIIRLVLVALVIWVGLWLIKYAQRATRRVVQRARPEDQKALESVLQRLVKIAGIALIITLALALLGVNVGALVASLGVVGLAVGFALRDTIEQWVCGTLLLIQRPFEIGDLIEVEGIEGVVTDVAVRTTEVRTADGIHVLIPNNTVYNNIIRNKTHYPARRYELILGFDYNTDIEQAQHILLEAVRTVPNILTDPPPTVTFEAFDEATERCIVRYWVSVTADSGAAHTAVATALTDAARLAGLKIATRVRTIVMDGQTAPQPVVLGAQT